MERSRARTFLLPQSCGTPITGPSASNRLSRRVWTDSGSTIWISTSFTLRFHFNPGTSRIRGIKTAMSLRPGPLEDPVVGAIAARVGKTPAQVLLAWAVQRGTALLTTPRTAARARENLNISALPEDALDEINRIQTRQRFNEVVKTGIPGFIPQGR